MKTVSLTELPPPSLAKAGWPWTEESPQFMPDGSFWPRISIVTPSYNQGQFIEETIRSVLLQGYPNLEYIIIDGGSTDNSVEIIKKYEPWLAYWVSEKDRGQGHAINKGIRKATGDILFWLNSDDLCLPSVFRLVAQTFHANSNVQLITGQAHLINEQGHVIGKLRSYFTSWNELVTNPGNSVRQISTFFSRSLFDDLGLVNESLYIAMDTELLVRFTQFHPPLILEDFLTAYRTHKNAKTFRQLIKGYEESDRTRKKYLRDRKQKSTYHRRSSSNWLNLSEFEEFTLKERLICQMRAIQNRPWIILSHDFRFSLKKLLMNSYSSAVGTERKISST